MGSTIDGRYDAQELIRVGGKRENIRRDWTSAQIRRMRKKYNKRLGKESGTYFTDEMEKFIKAAEDVQKGFSKFAEGVVLERLKAFSFTAFHKANPDFLLGSAKEESSESS